VNKTRTWLAWSVVLALALPGLATAGLVSRPEIEVISLADASLSYLRNKANTDWLGPCTPGQRIRLLNGVVQLDCTLCSVTNDGDERLTVTWRARWRLAVSIPGR